MENNIKFYKKTKTKNGKDVSSWIVNCINCGKERIINRKDHATRLSKKNVKAVQINLIIRKEIIEA